MFSLNVRQRMMSLMNDIVIQHHCLTTNDILSERVNKITSASTIGNVSFPLKTHIYFDSLNL